MSLFSCQGDEVHVWRFTLDEYVAYFESFLRILGSGRGGKEPALLFSERSRAFRSCARDQQNSSQWLPKVDAEGGAVPL